jgi:hypothetical protein
MHWAPEKNQGGDLVVALPADKNVCFPNSFVTEVESPIIFRDKVIVLAAALGETPTA